jgi:hypothetical protein
MLFTFTVKKVIRPPMTISPQPLNVFILEEIP